jgi:hypothetical protein
VLTKQALQCLCHTSSPFCSGYFGDGGLTDYLPKLALKSNPSILASQVTRITGMNHQCPDFPSFLVLLS